MTPDEQQLHQRFLRTFTVHESAIRAYVRRLVPLRADADDVMQEVAVVLWDKFAELADITGFRPWAFTVARYKVLSWLRDKGRDRLVLAEDVVEMLAEETVGEDSQLEKQRQALESCTDKLPSDQRSLLMRAYQAGASIQEIARSSGRTVAGFYQWLHRVRKILLDCVQQEIQKGGEAP